MIVRSVKSHLFCWLFWTMGTIWFACFPASIAGKQEIPIDDATHETRSDGFSNPVWIEIKGPIDRNQWIFLKSKLSIAKRNRADLIVLELDSPGGRLDYSYRIAEELRDLDWATTVVYCERSALSGAALVSLAADVLILSPSARIGDIGVIYQDPNAFAFRFAPAKIVSDVVAFGRILAEAKGRPAELVEAMIDKDVLVYKKHNADGQLELTTARVDAAEQPKGPWELVPESGPERFLELSGLRARELGLVEQVVNDREELSAHLKIRPDQIPIYRRTTTDTIAAWLIHPLAVGLLVVLGTLALYLELSAPGIGIGGILAALCAGLFFWSHFLEGTAGILEVALFLAGVGLILVEVLVIPGWGAAGLFGILLVICSFLLASQNFTIPNSASEFQQVIVSLEVLMAAAVTSGVGAWLITRKLGKIPIFNQMILSPPFAGSLNPRALGKPTSGKAEPPQHPVVSVGDWGQTITVLRPAGRARFAGALVDVVSDGDFIEPGQPIRILKILGNQVTVTRAQPDAPNSG